MKSDELIHYGILGMHWGIRKPEPFVGTKKSKELVSDHDRNLTRFRKHLKSRGMTEDLVRLKQGAFDFLDEHKKAVIATAIVAAAATAAVLYLKANKKTIPVSMFDQAKPYLDEFKFNWDKPVDMPAGSILQRVSSVAEDTPKAEGFFCAFLPDDVERYKGFLSGKGAAFLPSARMGSEGVLNDYRSLVPVKAPSASETVKYYKELAESNPMFRAWVEAHDYSRRGSILNFKAYDWQANLKLNSLHWSNDATDIGKTTFLTHLRQKGYTAVIDFNDAGNLSKTPLLTLDGSDFEIVKHTVVTIGEMEASLARGLGELLHAYITSLLESDELMHRDMFGHRWAQRL